MNCKNCGNPVPDYAARCPICGAATLDSTLGGKDHTAEMDPLDIQDNRGFALLSYLSLLVLIPIFAAPKASRYTRFHANQGLVLFIFSVVYQIFQSLVVRLLDLVLGFLPFIPGFVNAALGFVGILFAILAILGIVNAATGRARELPVIGGIRILK